MTRPVKSMFREEVRYCLRQTLITLLLFAIIPALYLMDALVYRTGLGPIWYLSNGYSLMLLALSFFMAFTVFRRETRDGALEYLFSLPIGKRDLFLCKIVPRIAILLLLLIPNHILLAVRGYSDQAIGGCLLPFSFTNNLALVFLIVLLGFVRGVIGPKRVITGLVLLSTLFGLWILYPWGFSWISMHGIGIPLLKMFSAIGLRNLYLHEMLPWTLSWALVTGLLAVAFVPVYRRWDMGSSHTREKSFLRVAFIPFLMVSLTVIFLYADIR